MLKKLTSEKNKTKTKQKYSFLKKRASIKKKYGLRLGVSVRVVVSFDKFDPAFSNFKLDAFLKLQKNRALN